MRRKTLLPLLAALLASILALPAVSAAAPILGGSVVVATDGEVVAKFLGHSAAFSNDLYLDSPANALGIIFNNLSTPVGTMTSLGLFTAGTELIFRIHVNDTGDDFFSGPGSRNPDDIPHAVVDDAFSATEAFVGFEDLFDGGDKDYDDLKFSFTNVKGVPTPEPGTLLLVTSGLVGLLHRILRRRVS